MERSKANSSSTEEKTTSLKREKLIERSIQFHKNIDIWFCLFFLPCSFRAFVRCTCERAQNTALAFVDALVLFSSCESVCVGVGGLEQCSVLRAVLSYSISFIFVSPNTWTLNGIIYYNEIHKQIFRWFFVRWFRIENKLSIFRSLPSFRRSHFMSLTIPVNSPTNSIVNGYINLFKTICYCLWNKKDSFLNRIKYIIISSSTPKHLPATHALLVFS